MFAFGYGIVVRFFTEVVDLAVDLRLDQKEGKRCRLRLSRLCIQASAGNDVSLHQISER